jgi:hypothetical protein
MPVSSIFFRRGLSYPGDKLRPRFDPRHPASVGITPSHGICAAVIGSGFMNLITGLGGTNVGAPAQITRPLLGPCFNYNSSARYTQFTGMQAVADTAWTMASIFISTNANGGICGSSTVHTALGGVSMYNNAGAFAFANGTNGNGTGITITANIPYLIIATGTSTNGSMNYAQTRLDTGAVVTSLNQSSGAQTASAGIYEVGDNANQGASIGPVAAFMYAPARISVAAMVQWAQDPWSFWYPTSPVVDVVLTRGPTVAGGLNYRGLTTLGVGGP